MNEADNLFIPLGEIIFHADEIEFERYPFFNSIAFRKSRILADSITDIEIEATPPNLRVEDELIFVRADKKILLKLFADRHNISIVSRAPVWEWILEPFLDTSFSELQQELTISRLAAHGLDKDKVDGLRNLVSDQMIQYNFKSMLWDETSLSVYDVLSAMKPTQSDQEFDAFYNEVMRISLKEKNTIHSGSFRVRVYDNFHYMDESEAYDHGEFGSFDEAQIAAQQIVLDFLQHAWKPGITNDELVSAFCMFGDDPVILSEDIHLYPHFSGRDFVQTAVSIIRHEMDPEGNT